MKIKNWFKVVTLIAVVVCGSWGYCLANTVPEDSAILIAQTYSNLKVSKTVSDTGAVYIFDLAPKGFIIISKDDRAEPILAYSTESDFSFEVKNGIDVWLTAVHKSMKYVIDNNISATKDITAKWNILRHGQKYAENRSTVVPLCKTTWNQSPYYNNYCPGGSVTGCVATCMGQIMKYYNYPPHGNGASNYNSTYGNLSADYDSVINWSLMSLNLTSKTLADSVNAVALFLYKIGVSVDMQYSPSGSGSYVTYVDGGGLPCAQSSFVKYYNYNANTLKNLSFSNFTTNTWDSIIYAENNAGRVVEYVGFGSDGGHTWVEDGYNGSGLMHMNWGWGGLDNGYFSEASLNPSGIPLGSNNELLIGIEPGTTHNCNTPVISGISGISDTSAIINIAPADSFASFTVAYQQTGATQWKEYNTTSVNYLAHPLYSGTDYICEVAQNCTNGGSSSFTKADSFKTIGLEQCATPIPHGVYASSYYATISWTPITSALSYVLKYQVQGSNTWTYQNVTDTLVTITTLPGAAYYFSVQARCSGDTSLSSYYTDDINQFYTYPACDGVDTLVFDSIGVGSTKVSWKNVAGAKYNIGYNCIANCTGNGMTSFNATSVHTPYYISGNSQGTFEVHLTTSCADGGSFTSPYYDFTTTDILYQQPPVNAMVVSLTPTTATFAWDSIKYLWDYGLQFNGAYTYLQTNSYKATGLKPNTTYTFEVQALSLRYGLSNYCVPVSFTTPDSITYCSTRGSTTVEYIKSFSFGNVTNVLRDTKGYGDFIKDTINVIAGQSYSILAIPAFTRQNTPQDEYWTLFADYNHSGVLQLIAGKHGIGDISGKVIIPDSTLIGATRLRIAMNRGKYETNPCANIKNGDVEDYTLLVSGATNAKIAQVQDNTILPTSGTWAIYPNPTTGVIYLNVPETFKVYNILGQCILSGDSVNSFNLSNYAKGIYILRFEDGETKKIVKL